MQHPVSFHGLSTQEIEARRRQYGPNLLYSGRRSHFLQVLGSILKEPMFILLATACVAYFLLGKLAEGLLMLVAMSLVSMISLYQGTRSARALKALRNYIEPKVLVLREAKQKSIDSSELVPGDIILLEEGMRVPADATVLQSNDFSTDDSLITGESIPVEKSRDTEPSLYQGTVVNSGKCYAVVTATGLHTTLGRIGKSIDEYASSKTLLQVQLNRFVTRFAFFGFAGFIIILVFNYLLYDDFITSLLFALTVAMSVIPEEIPVAFSSFMALGAAKMARAGIISRQPQVIENLGAVNVLCLDKTGTLTENKMKVACVYDHQKGTPVQESNFSSGPGSLLWYALLASERNPYDAMEKAIIEAYYLLADDKTIIDIPMIREYSLEGRPPMMTHVYKNNTGCFAVAKGGPETILSVCKLWADEKERINGYIQQLGAKGYRVLGVAKAVYAGDELPGRQQDFEWQFTGLVALYDAPRENAKQVIGRLYDAGVTVKLVTGDYPATATTVAQQSGITNALYFRTGEEVMQMDEEALRNAAATTNVFARMFPEAKLKLINALRASGNITGMTGDGVNDGPALKGADIGIAMGRNGSETARRSADLVLAQDNLEAIVEAVYEGRKIFSNLIKAIRYIIAIHIPIILTASLPLLLGWQFPNIFTPIHVIVLELIMAPTCSIFFEKEPVEKAFISNKARSYKAGLFTVEELLIAIVQGLVITGAVLSLYYIFMQNGLPVEETRMIVFTTLLIANVFLTFTDRSFTRTIWHTSRYKNTLAPVVVLVPTVFLSALHFIPAVQHLFGVSAVTPAVFWLCFAVAFCSVAWFEVYKSGLRKL